MQISVSATGHIKKYLPEEKIIVVKDDIMLGEIKTLVGIPSSVNNGFLVNGRIKRIHDTVEDGANVKFIMLVGAG